MFFLKMTILRSHFFVPLLSPAKFVFGFAAGILATKSVQDVSLKGSLVELAILAVCLWIHHRSGFQIGYDQGVKDAQQFTACAVDRILQAADCTVGIGASESIKDWLVTYGKDEGLTWVRIEE